MKVIKHQFAIWKPSAFTSAYRALRTRPEAQRAELHALRHAHASQLLKAGVDAKVISKRLGHSRASFTMDVYAHLMPGQDEEAAKRIDAGFGKALKTTAPSRQLAGSKWKTPLANRSPKSFLADARGNERSVSC
jgi:intergrase/recombinase